MLCEVYVRSVWGHSSLWFDLHFPDDYWCWTPFHVYIGHLFVFRKYIFRSFAQFELWHLVLYVLLVSCMNPLYILDTNCLLGIWFVKIYSHSMSCLFILLMIIFISRSFLISCSPTCFYFLFSLSFLIQIQTIANSSVKELTPCVLSKSFMIPSLAFKYLINFELIFMFKIGMQFHSFTYGYLVWPVPFIEEILLHWVFLVPLLKINCVCMSLFLGSLFRLLTCMSDFNASTITCNITCVDCL